MVRIMTIEDYEGVYALWKKIKGFGIRSIDDSKEGVARFLANETRLQVSWQKKTVALLEVFCAVTTEDGGVCIMSV